MFSSHCRLFSGQWKIEDAKNVHSRVSLGNPWLFRVSKTLYSLLLSLSADAIPGSLGSSGQYSKGLYTHSTLFSSLSK